VALALQPALTPAVASWASSWSTGVGLAPVEVGVDVRRDLDRVRTQLIAHVGEGLAVLDQSEGVGMAGGAQPEAVLKGPGAASPMS
jgi:hypothetical protein